MSDRPFDPRGFVRELMERATNTVDAMDTDEMAERYGLLESRPLTAEQVADKDGPWNKFYPEWEWEEGNEWLFWSDGLKEWLGADGPSYRFEERPKVTFDIVIGPNGSSGSA